MITTIGSSTALAHIQNVLAKTDGLMVIESKTGVFTSKFLYVTSFKGFYLYCKSKVSS